MYHLKLLAIARAAGLSQAAIARHLGITPIQVTRWAKGTRPLPPKHLLALWDLVFTTIAACVESEQADVPAHTVGQHTLAELAGLDGKTQFRRDLETLRDELYMEFVEMRGKGPSAWIVSTFVALDALPREPKELRKPANTAKLIELGRALTHYGTLLSQIGPIQDLLGETDDADDAR